MSIRRVPQQELAYLLTQYETLDDLAQDLTGGDRHEVELAEIWGMVKAYGKACPGLRDYDAFCLYSDQKEPIVVIESDGSIMPPIDWAGLMSKEQNQPGSSVSQWFEKVP